VGTDTLGHVTQWFSADLHLGHANIIRYCDRPFDEVDEMNAGLVARWNAVVAPTDTVWVLGDVAMGRISLSLPWVAELNGHLALLTGNHDRCWPGHGATSTEWVQAYLDAGFAEIHHGAIDLDVTADDGRTSTMLACHFPYVGDSQDLDRYPGARPTDEGRWLLHGHVHEVWRQNGRMINVGIDAWGGQPVSAATVLDLVAAGESDLAPLRWAGGPSAGLVEIGRPGT
jgi:calcineurin-like phosphoesterase family protein